MDKSMLVPLILLFFFYIVPELFKLGKKKKKYEYPKFPEVKGPEVKPPEIRLPEIKPPEIKFPGSQPAPSKPIPQIIWPKKAEPDSASVKPAQVEVKKPAPSFSEPAQVHAVADHAPLLSPNLSPQWIVNGVIFAEIISPPRAYRPFGRHRR